MPHNVILTQKEILKEKCNPSSRLLFRHFQEWINSRVDPEIAKLNAKSLDGDQIYHLCYNLPRSERTNPGTLRTRWFNRYRHCEAGGWWCDGVDVLTGDETVFEEEGGSFKWGQFKPDEPRTYEENKGFGQTKTKRIKYESPPKADTEIYALRITQEIWQRITKLNNIPMPEKIAIEGRTGQAIGFWSWVINNPSIPLIITEGAKKAGALLTAGYAAIALPGIYNGYRQDKNEFGKRIGLPKLIPQLEIFAKEGREINFCFDNDPKPKTRKNVRKAIVKTGKLFELKGCSVKVISWTHPAKGVDDLIMATDADYFHDRYDDRKPLLHLELADLLNLSPYVDLTVNERYLPPNLTPPKNAQIIGLCSGKGTGKTEYIAVQVERNRERGIKTLVIVHRIQLAKALANRFGIDHIEEIRSSETGGVFGYSLCIDSLHGKSQAKFNPEEWEGAHVIIDEAEQVIWHLLNSQTCQKKRVSILDDFEKLVKTVIATGGKIYLSDADLSPIAIIYLEKLIGYPVKRWIIKNVYGRNRRKRKLFAYDGNDPRELVTALKKAIAEGQKTLIHTSGQKHRSGTGTINLEKYLKKLFPDRKILRIDSETVADPQHPAYGCMGNLDGILPQYDIVLASPVVETGVSIDIKGHFDSVWGIAWGVQTVDAVCQALERLREDVPRHLWARKTGFNFVGNGATNVKQLLASTHKLARANIYLLQRAGINDFDDFDSDWQKAHLEAWAKRAVLVNAGMKKYRASILEKLRFEGYDLVNPHCDPDPELKAQLTEEFERTKKEIAENKEAGYKEHCESVSDAEDYGDRELEQLRDKKAKTEAERLAERKGNLKQRYGVKVTPELVEKDDKGWYPKLRLYYYLTIGNQFLPERDKRKLAALTEDTGKAFKPDINRQCLGISIYALQKLEIEQFFDENAEFSKYSLADWYGQINNPRTKAELKSALGVNVCEGDSPIQAANKFLKLLGLKLEEKRWAGGRDDKHRIYRGCKLNADDRDRILAQWHRRDSEQFNKEEAA